jgi:pimeloyl-ACP methyl ester carboxylesterase
VEALTQPPGGRAVSGPAPPTVVLVHGLWFGAWSLALLARRLRRAGFEPLGFHYRSTLGGLEQHARELRRFVAQYPRESMHFVAHSMGGLLVLKMLADFDEDLPAGRVVLLGCPLRGSVVARRSARIPGGRRLLGQALRTLERDHGSVRCRREVAMIAGTRGMGLGVLVGGTGGPGDGTVAVAETRAEGLADRLELPVTHTGMLFSKPVAEQVCELLREGHFGISLRRGSAC